MRVIAPLDLKDTISAMSTADPIVVATDGSALGNPGAGGWCWWVHEQRWEAGGDPGPVTNNQMEIVALERALETFRVDPLIVEIDAQYVLQAVTRWHHGWRRNGWRNSSGKPVANREMLERVLTLLDDRKSAGLYTDLRWVRGHNGSHRNENADQLAREAAGRARRDGRALRLRP